MNLNDKNGMVCDLIYLRLFVSYINALNIIIILGLANLFFLFLRT